MHPLIYVVRHGETDWNRERRLQGQTEIDINDTGRGQAEANGSTLARLTGDGAAFDFVASPMRRARQTMEILRRSMGLDPEAYSIDPLLLEVSFGDWEGFTFAELEASHPGVSTARDGMKWRYVPPGARAESYAMMAERVGRWLEAVDRPTICVGHGGTVRALLRLVAGVSEEEAAEMSVPQDRVLRLEGRQHRWL